MHKFGENLNFSLRFIEFPLENCPFSTGNFPFFFEKLDDFLHKISYFPLRNY